MLAAVALTLSTCGSAKVTAQREVGTAPTAKPSAIYVADFDLDPTAIEPSRTAPRRRHHRAVR